MDERKLEIGGFYRHFKNKLYQVKCIAYHSETKEKMVVYQAMYGDFSVYVRPYDMFVSEVDHIKYPDISQVYRFEQINPCELEQLQQPMDVDCQIEKDKVSVEELPVVSVAEAENERDDGEVDARLLLFLDAESYKDKLDTLAQLRISLDDKLIDAMAASLDVEVPEGPVEKRYTSLRSCILAHAKYECSRLR